MRDNRGSVSSAITGVYPVDSVPGECLPVLIGSCAVSLAHLCPLVLLRPVQARSLVKCSYWRLPPWSQGPRAYSWEYVLSHLGTAFLIHQDVRSGLVGSAWVVEAGFRGWRFLA